MAGGAAGNLIDRVRLGHVVDYLDVHIWPVFNLADVAIVLGAAILIVALSREGSPAPRR
jgi:signal peptidase II